MLSNIRPSGGAAGHPRRVHADRQWRSAGGALMSEHVTYWISFETQTTREWLGTLIVDSKDIPLDEESGEAFITRLVEKELCPPSGDRWNVQFQKLPAGTEIPQQHKNRLITDSSVTAALGGVMISHHGAN
jgi:hypothetical protein